MSERTFACRGGEYFADGQPIDPLLELAELEGELAAARALLRELLDNMDDGWLPELHRTDSWVKRAKEAAGGGV